MQIIPATTDHAEVMHRIHDEGVRAACVDFYTSEQIEAWLGGRSPEGYHKGIKKGEMFVAEDNGEVVGFGHVVPGEIVAIFVDHGKHGMGIGKALVEHAIEMASDGERKVIVRATLNAIPFYEKSGFVKVKEDADIDNGVEVPVLIMELA
jgi:predicted N-acetyltransferase YhbS